MELSGIIALVLVSFVNGTPYGYGVKSGPLAKAEANAASGAIVQPVSLTIPSGASFSGSFSKSSSSSFASSSSSAHSSSFSYSGSGVNGIGGIGCNSNNCKNGLNVIPLHGSTFNGVQNSGAFASAASGETAGSFSNQNSNLCKDGNCYGANTSGNKCLSGKCSSNDNLQSQSQPTVSPNKYESENDCSSGHCNPSIQQGNAPSQYGSQQQPNNVDSTDTSPETSSTGEEDDLFVALSHSTDSTHKKPSVVLNTPNLEEACTSHTCNQASLGSYSNGKLPSSYNVPILGTYPSAPQVSTAPACNSPNCIGNPSASNIVSGPTKHLESTNPDYGVQYQPGSVDIGLAQQNIPTYTGSTGSVGTDQLLGSSKPFLSKLPSIEDSPKHTVGFGGSTNSINGNVQGSYPSNFITESPSSSPSYFSQNLHPGYAVGSSQNEAQNSEGYTSHESVGSQQTSLDSSKPNINYLSPSQEQKPNSGYRPSGTNGENLPSISFSSMPYASTYTSPSYPRHTTDLSPNGESSHHGPAYTGGFGGPSGPMNGNFGHGSFHGSLGASNLHSSAVTPVKDAPTYTGGFGGPAGAIDASIPAGTKPSSKPGHEGGHAETTHTSADAKPSTGSSSPYNPSIPAYTGGFGGPSGSFVGHFGHGSLHGSQGTKPHYGSNLPGKDTPIYTGGFGGPAGPVDKSFPVKDVATTLEHDKKTDNLPHQTAHTSSDTLTSGINSVSNVHSGEDAAVSKPSNTLVPPHHDNINNGLHGSTTAAHSSNIPKSNSEEFLKPNEYNLPVTSPSSALGNIKVLPCTTGGCNSKAKSGVTSEKSNVSPHEASGAVSASAAAKAVAYSGGFGGPPGLLKPFDDGKHLKAYHVGSLSPSQGNAGQAQSGAQAHASAQVNAVAFASAGAFGANQGFSGTGCDSGWEPDGNSEGNLPNIARDSVPETGLNKSNHAAGASAIAKSVAGAGTGSLAAGRSFASAHASAGAAVKGGYGK